jgi:branched-chain amino acid transport system permease protein
MQAAAVWVRRLTSGHGGRSAVVALLAAVVLAAALLPQLTQRRDTLNLFFLIYLYVTLALSWNILGGYAGQINLGHAAFFGIGSMATRGLWTDEGFPFLLAMLAGGAASVLFALVVGVATFRLRGVCFAIGTLALASLRITVAT